MPLPLILRMFFAPLGEQTSRRRGRGVKFIDTRSALTMNVGKMARRQINILACKSMAPLRGKAFSGDLPEQCDAQLKPAITRFHY